MSGAHLYGFASPDSDVDLRGAFLLPAQALLGLHPVVANITTLNERFRKEALNAQYVHGLKRTPPPCTG